MSFIFSTITLKSQNKVNEISDSVLSRIVEAFGALVVRKPVQNSPNWHWHYRFENSFQKCEQLYTSGSNMSNRVFLQHCSVVY